jgi:hypothetical protein
MGVLNGYSSILWGARWDQNDLINFSRVRSILSLIVAEHGGRTSRLLRLMGGPL